MEGMLNEFCDPQTLGVAVVAGLAVTATAKVLQSATVKPFPYTAPTARELPVYTAGEPVYATEPHAGVPIRYASTGMAATRFGTVPQLLDSVATSPETENTVALRVEKPNPPKDAVGEWLTWTWREYRDESRKFGRALLALGFQPFEAVAICGFNGPYWFIAHMGTQYAVGLSAGTYTTNTPDACKYVADHSKSRVVVVDNLKTLQKYLDVDLETVKHIVVALEEIPEDLAAKFNAKVVDSRKSTPSKKKKKGSKRGGGGGGSSDLDEGKDSGAEDELEATSPVDTASKFLLNWSEFLSLGDHVAEEDLETRMEVASVEQCTTLIYTSGTMGTPKAVMMSHDNVQFGTMAGITAALGHFVDPKTSPVKAWDSLSYLPLSHVAAQILDIMFPLFIASSMKRPYTVSFARPDALKGTLAVSLKAVRPTYFFGVPRVWEKLQEGIKAKAKATPPSGLKLKLINFAKKVGLECSLNRQVGGSGAIPVGYSVANKVVYSAVKKALGLDRCIGFVSAAAPIQRETLNFFASLGMDITEVYGMSETTGNGTCGHHRRFHFGATGVPMIAQEMKLEHLPGRDKPGQGEICYRGRQVMMGYLRNEEKTRETIDADGWLHSGDVGRFSSEMQLFITGRLKEIIIGAGGENIAPVPIEDELKRLCPAISNAMMIGDQRKYNTVIVTLKAQPNLDTGDFFDQLAGDAAEVDAGIKTVTAARNSEAFRQLIQTAVDAYNNGHTCVSHAQKIQKFTILATDLSIPGGELTGTMKMKRSYITEKYSEEIEAMYV